MLTISQDDYSTLCGRFCKEREVLWMRVMDDFRFRYPGDASVFNDLAAAQQRRCRFTKDGKRLLSRKTRPLTILTLTKRRSHEAQVQR